MPRYRIYRIRVKVDVNKKKFFPSSLLNNSPDTIQKNIVFACFKKNLLNYIGKTQTISTQNISNIREDALMHIKSVT